MRFGFYSVLMMHINYCLKPENVKSSRRRQLLSLIISFLRNLLCFIFGWRFLLLATGNPDNCFSSLLMSVVLSSKKFMTIYNVYHLKRQNALTETTPCAVEWWESHFSLMFVVGS